VRRAGGVPRFVTLQPPHFRLTEEALAKAFSPRTKVALFNNPLNPTATIFSDDDLALLADFCIRFDAVALCDEVWEHVVFDGRRHKPLIAVPGMRERTVKVGSAGKIFNLTGWKVGFVCAAPPLMRVLAKAHQFITFTTPPNLQAAVAYGLSKDDAHFENMRADFARSRDRFTAGLTGLGFAVIPSQATYFLNIDIAPLGETDDVAFAKRLVLDHGVATIPVSAFYAEGAVKNVVRFCFAKRDATLDAALERLAGVVRRAA
jgi:aspartate/methionine/tyrosine aminotransferase